MDFTPYFFDIEKFSTYHCVFCSEKLDGKSKLLQCLHITCNKCFDEKFHPNTGIQCKCLTFSKDFLTEYPIISPEVLRKECNAYGCIMYASKICDGCQLYFCNHCSKIHLSQRTNHITNIKEYPPKNEIKKCFSCKGNSANRMCLQCSVYICYRCSAIAHGRHDAKDIKKCYKNTLTKLAEDKHDIKKKNSIFKHCIDETEKYLQVLENKKKMVYEEIDKEMEMLHLKLEERSIKLKKEVDKRFLETRDQLSENKSKALIYKKTNKYYTKLALTISKHSNQVDVINLSELFRKQLNIIQTAITNLPIDIPALQCNLKLYDKDSFDECMKIIESLGKMPPLMEYQQSSTSNENSLISTNNMQSSNNLLSNMNFGLSEITRPFVPISRASSDSSIEERILDEIKTDSRTLTCDCCKEFSDDRLPRCYTCGKYYHNECHIPPLPQQNSAGTYWECTLCKDMGLILRNINLSRIDKYTTVREHEREVLQRMLLELYCHGENYKPFQVGPPEYMLPDYTAVIPNPIFLNKIKWRLFNDIEYTFFGCIEDMKQVFRNAMTIYGPDHPDYDAALNINNFLASLIKKYLMPSSSFRAYN